MSLSNNPKHPKSAPDLEAQPIPQDEVTGSGNAQDVELKPGIKVLLNWKKIACCQKTFYVDPDGGVLREKDGDSSSTAHQHENEFGEKVVVHAGEERLPIGLRQAQRDHP